MTGGNYPSYIIHDCHDYLFIRPPLGPGQSETVMIWSGLGGFLYFAFPDSFLGGKKNCLGSCAPDKKSHLFQLMLWKPRTLSISSWDQLGPEYYYYLLLFCQGSQNKLSRKQMRRKKTLLAAIAGGLVWQVAEILYVTGTQAGLRQKERKQQALNMWSKTYSLLLVLKISQLKVAQC